MNGLNETSDTRSSWRGRRILYTIKQNHYIYNSHSFSFLSCLETMDSFGNGARQFSPCSCRRLPYTCLALFHNDYNTLSPIRYVLLQIQLASGCPTPYSILPLQFASRKRRSLAFIEYRDTRMLLEIKELECQSLSMPDSSLRVAANPPIHCK